MNLWCSTTFVDTNGELRDSEVCLCLEDPEDQELLQKLVVEFANNYRNPNQNEEMLTSFMMRPCTLHH